MRHLRSEEEAILVKEFPAWLEIVGHVERAAGSAPVGRTDRVVPNRVEHIAAFLTVAGEPNGGRRTMKQTGRRRRIASDLSQVVLWRVTQRVVPHAGIDPRACFVHGQ